MTGIVGTDEEQLKGISARIHQALESSAVDYVAQEYGDPIQHPNEADLFALIILDVPAIWHPIIMDSLTQEEKLMMQVMGSDWFSS